eukprot:10365772-Lingulodinium_polyedra.AAC.1
MTIKAFEEHGYWWPQLDFEAMQWAVVLDANEFIVQEVEWTSPLSSRLRGRRPCCQARPVGEPQSLAAAAARMAFPGCTEATI